MIGDKIIFIAGTVAPTKIVENVGKLNEKTVFEISEGEVKIDCRSAEMKKDMKDKFGIPE